MTKKTVLVVLNIAGLFLYMGMICANAQKPVEEKQVFEYEVPVAINGSQIPGLDLMSPKWTQYYAMQFGPESDDCIYFVFDSTDELKPPDRLFIYVPQSKDFKKPVLFKGTRTRRDTTSKTRQYYNRFRPVEVATRFQWMEAEYRFLVRTDHSGVEILITSNIKKSSRRSRFILHGEHSPISGADNTIPVTRILEHPRLIIDMDHRASRSRVVCKVKMGRYHLLPVSGMSPRISLVITDHKTGRFKLSEKAEFDEDNYIKGLKVTPSKPLMSGRLYLAELKVDMGNLFGKMSAVSEIMPRK